MKKHPLALLITLGLTVLTHQSCNERNLDLQPFSITEASFFTEEIDYDRNILAVYAKLTDFYWFNNNSPIHGFWQLPGDDITTLGTDANEIFGTIAAGQGRVNTYYRTAYQLVNRANTALEKNATAPEGVYKTPNLRNFHKGEALFLRGLMFFDLWNFFGTSPLITERIQTTDRITPPSSTGNQLLDQAIKDFEEAAALLPPSWPVSNRGRATANSANGMLGKALVFRGTVTKSTADHAAALAALNKITDRSLMPDFQSNFDARDENNAESLFEFQASQPTSENVWLNNDFDNAIGAISAYWGWYENHWSLFGAPPYIATRKLRDAFEVGDPRGTGTLDSASRRIKKYVARDEKTNTGVGSLNNVRILRYADVLLLKAEATLQSGGSIPDAIAFINQVRTRARLMRTGGTVPANRSAAQTDRAVIMDWIRQERFVEFAGEEGNRWFDLRRWHLGEQINLATFDFSSDRQDFAFVLPKHLYYPIPTSEIDLNPNITQNPGY